MKEVQYLTGHMAALSCFLSTSGDKGYPYFQCLKKNNCFARTDECEKAFIKLKEYLASLLVLGKPIPGILIRLYYSIIDRTINSVVFQKQDKVQKPNYFVSKVLHGQEVRYEPIEKATLAVVFITR